MIEFLTAYKDVFVVLHSISFAIGLGAASVHDLAFAHYLHQFDKERWNALAHTICYQLIRTSLFWTLLSGLALFLPTSAALASSALFQFKVLLVGILCINTWFFHQKLLPKLADSFWYDPRATRQDKKRLRQLHRLSFIFGSVSLTSWYSTVSLAGLKNLELGFFPLLSIYLGLLALSGLGSLMAEARLANRLEHKARAVLRGVASELLTQRKLAASSNFWEAYRMRSLKLSSFDNSGKSPTIN